MYAQRPSSTSGQFITTGTTRDTIRGTPCPVPLVTPAPGRAASYLLALCPRPSVLLLPPLSAHALCVQCAMQTRPPAPPSPSPRPLFGHLLPSPSPALWLPCFCPLRWFSCITRSTMHDKLRSTSHDTPFTPAPGRAVSHLLALCPRPSVLLLPPLFSHALCMQCALLNPPPRPCLALSAPVVWAPMLLMPSPSPAFWLPCFCPLRWFSRTMRSTTHDRLRSTSHDTHLGHLLNTVKHPEGLEPRRRIELHTCVLGQQLRGQAAQSAKHSPTCVDQLGLTVCGEVPTVVTRVLTSEVVRGGGIDL